MNGDTLDIFISQDQGMKPSEPVWCMTTVSTVNALTVLIMTIMALAVA